MIYLDDNIEDHPKFIGLSDAAFALWVRCLGYCRRNLTDGFVPEAAALQRARGRTPRKTIEELVSTARSAPGKAPLWSKTEGGYQVHDYLDWNVSRHDESAKRAARQQAGRMGGTASAQRVSVEAATTKQREQPKSAESISGEQATCLGFAQARGRVSTTDPTTDPIGRAAEAGPPTKAKRKSVQSTCPARDAPRNEILAWCQHWKIPGPDDPQVVRFLHHHRAKGSKFASWDSAWDNWLTGRFVGGPAPQATAVDPLFAASQERARQARVIAERERMEAERTAKHAAIAATMGASS